MLNSCRTGLIYNLDSVPLGINVDEAGMSYDAWSLANFGVDRALHKFPVYLVNFGGGQSALYAYLAMFFIKIFGYSACIARMPAVILSIAAIICSYLMAKEHTNKNKALLFMFLVAIAPWHIMQSRFGLDCNLLSSMFIISIYFLTRAKSYLSYIVAGIFFGLSLYTYALSYIIIPIFLLLCLSYLLYIKKIRFKQIIVLGIPIFILAAPLLLMILINNGFISEIAIPFFTIPKLPGYRGSEISLINIFKNLHVSTMIFKNDWLVYNTLPEFGTIYFMSIPFAIIGIVMTFKNTIKNIKEKIFSLDTVMLIAFISPLLCSLLITGPNINKSNALFIPLLYFVSVGIFYIIKKNINILYLIITIYLINFVSFAQFYFVEYPKKYINQPYFDYELVPLTKYLESIDEFAGEDIYIETNAEQPYIYTLLGTLISPYDYNEQKYTRNYHYELPENIDDQNIYVIKNNDLINNLIQNNFSYKEYNEFKIFYKP